MGSKFQPFKALGGALKAVGPLASFIPGLNYASLWGAGAGMLGNLMGGGGGQKNPNGSTGGYGTDAQMALLAPVLKLLKDPGAAKAMFDQNAFGQAADTGAALGGLVESQTGQPGASAAIQLGQMNQATEASNRFGQDVYSPAGQGRAAASILPLMQGINAQHLQKYQINQEYQKPTFFESIFSAGANSLPWILDQYWPKKKKPTDWGGGSNTSSSNINQGMPLSRG